MGTLVENYLHFMKNCIRPPYKKLKSLKSGFVENSNVSAAIIPQICQLIYTTEISNWANFANVLHKKFAPKMSNHSPLSGNPVLPVLCWNWDRPAAPSPHQLLRHIRSMNWQLSKLFELDSNITQISTHFLKYYTNIYTLSPGFDGLQEGLQGFTKISRKLK